MKSARSRILLGVAALLTVTVAGALRAGDVSAQAGGRSQEITLSPPSTRLSIDPGGSVSETFKVINSGGNPYDLKVSSSPYFVEGVTYEPTFKKLPGKTDASGWVKVTDAGSSTLGPNENRTVKYTVNVPRGTAPGGYYAIIFAASKPKSNNGSITATNRLGNILYITVKGDVATKGSVEATGLSSIVLDDAVKPGVLVSNTGGVHFETEVKQNITNVLGKSVFKSDAKRIVLPETQREVTSEWGTTPPIGLFKVSQTATVAGNEESVPAKWVLIIKPWVLMVIIAAIALLTAWIIRKKKRGSAGHKKG